ncbi:MAG TPA: hypothetical protein VLD85_12975 [Anaeromyxobacteraceae bacterium]|nr:hypothetical protein [Anaeromyxobacteraceae bacterium]
MPPRAPTGLLLAAGLLAGCSSRNTGIDRGPATYVDPTTTPRACPAPTLVNGGTNPAPDPGATCIRTPQESGLDPVPAATYGWIDLGEHLVGEQVPFSVPAGTASITVLEQWVSGSADTVTVTIGGSTGSMDNAAVVGELRDPSGLLVYSDFRVGAPSDGSGDLLFWSSPQPVTGTVTYPNTSAALTALGAAGVAPGTWTAVVNDYAYECFLAGQPSPPPGLAPVSCDAASSLADGRYRLFVLTKAAGTGSPSAVPDTGTLDVDFHIVDAPSPIIGIDAAGAMSDPRVARMVETYGSLLSWSGVCLGTVTFYDAPDWARSRFATGVAAADSGPCSSLSQLLTLSIPRARAIDLFLVSRITSTSGTVLGIDGSIPGPATVNATVASGAAVTGENLLVGTCPAPGGALSLGYCGADVVAYIAAHESGHFLGLYHVSEGDGAQFDPLSDTPHCECSPYCFASATACAAGLPPTGCDQHYQRCSGAKNLMFWAVDAAVSVGYLSPQQAQIVRASPLVRSP